jgi:DNA helicase II / ATP-dependent DNA helicase PcrA
MSTPETEERQRLADVQARLRDSLRTIDARLTRYAREIQDQKTYLWESRADMDHVEKVFTRQVIEQSVMTGDTVLAQRTRLARLLGSTRPCSTQSSPGCSPATRPSSATPGNR